MADGLPTFRAASVGCSLLLLLVVPLPCPGRPSVPSPRLASWRRSPAERRDGRTQTGGVAASRGRQMGTWLLRAALPRSAPRPVTRKGRAEHCQRRPRRPPLIVHHDLRNSTSHSRDGSLLRSRKNEGTVLGKFPPPGVPCALIFSEGVVLGVEVHVHAPLFDSAYLLQDGIMASCLPIGRH